MTSTASERRPRARDVDPAGVDADRNRLEPVVGEQPARLEVARILDADPACAAGPQHARDERERLGDAAAHHDPLGRRLHAADPAEVGGERGAQPRVPGGIRVAEVGVGRLAQRPPRGPRPGQAREQRQVGRAGAQVEARERGVARDGVRGRGDRPRRHPRRRARPHGEVPLGGELAVRLDHHAARDAELRGQRPARRQPSPAASRPARTASRSCASSCACSGPASRLSPTSSSGELVRFTAPIVDLFSGPDAT